MGRKLTTKQKLFVEFYNQNPNGTAAARKAGYKGRDTTLAQVASENLRKPYVRALIEKRLEEAAMTSDEVLTELSEIAKCDWKDFLVVKRDKKTDEVIDATFRLNDKIRALELIGKHHRLFVDKIEHSGKITQESVVVLPKEEEE